jgi:hypothetical protein
MWSEGRNEGRAARGEEEPGANAVRWGVEDDEQQCAINEHRL